MLYEHILFKNYTQILSPNKYHTTLDSNTLNPSIMTTTQAKFSTDTDKPKVAKVTIRTSNVNPGPFAANASNTEFNEPGVYLTLE
ncbi:MAG: hypothetical protein KDC44_14385, partial [Phaeodactylibacter sp.]|nr:hypothetical protein [Phaeodactylibacter sp.]